MSELWPGC
uniref:Uncharacterized protein n=1 Tax=Anguilla anguilla TaxID=7936 RepID=A0A0E9VHE5_ANGAN